MGQTMPRVTWEMEKSAAHKNATRWRANPIKLLIDSRFPRYPYHVAARSRHVGHGDHTHVKRVNLARGIRLAASN
jgi:hypothetical protein